ncbi:hypothetical protein PR048_030909 [Dryococelus australis]|uniref:Uncharacterized protein n=1 Tax=Dryococelus australis TaxID=614101 RepID=A0ABQ9GA73_9NEOP|nr:hypothetical protein PR048_030909 [Dryococelus australis]
MADETTDISIKKQLAICIRYFDTTSCEIQEKFFKFIDVIDVSGENIARTIVQELDRLNLDISYCSSQAYDTSLTRVANSKVSRDFFWQTRWDEKHDAVLTFLDTLPCLSVVLGTISESPESRRSNAFSFLHAIQPSEFLVSGEVLAVVFGLTLALAGKLQAGHVHVLEATLASLREQRYKSTDTFKKIFKESEKLAVEMGDKSISQEPTNLQKNRSNVGSQTVEEYYRTAVYLSFMDFIISELSFRFPKSELQRVGQIQKLLSPEFSDGFEDEVLQVAELY